MPNPAIVIVGAGAMGQGLAEAIATQGSELYLLDQSTDKAELGKQRIAESIDREIRRWGLTKSDKKAILARIHPTAEYEVLKEADTVFESIPENLDAKRRMLAEVEPYCRPDALIVSTTGTLSITRIARYTLRPERLVGMHFLNPVSQIPLAEVVRGRETSDSAFKRAVAFARSLDKQWIEVNEYPGYVTTRIIVPMINEAMHVLMEGVASAEDIDKAMKLGFGFHVGPLALADMMGLDVVNHWMNNLLAELADHKYNPAPILRRKVLAGELGVKTGRGFFDYDERGNRQLVTIQDTDLEREVVA